MWNIFETGNYTAERDGWMPSVADLKHELGQTATVERATPTFLLRPCVKEASAAAAAAAPPSAQARSLDLITATAIGQPRDSTAPLSRRMRRAAEGLLAPYAACNDRSAAPPAGGGSMLPAPYGRP